MRNVTILTLTALIAVLALIAAIGTCFAATLTVGQNSAIPSQNGVSVPVSLSSGVGEQVAAAQFDIMFSSAILVLSDATAGPAASSAGKDISFSTVEPGRVRLIIAGFNQNVIPDGIIANALFNVNRDAPGGEESLSLSGVLLSDPNGVAVPSESVPGRVSIAAVVPTGGNGARGITFVCAVFVALALAVGGAKLWHTGVKHR
jgi:hypothetical protein